MIKETSHSVQTLEYNLCKLKCHRQNEKHEKTD